MERLTSLFKRLMAVCLATLIAFVFSAIGNGPELQAQARTERNAATTPEKVDSKTVKRVREKAEDFGGEKIGDTGLKNIRNLGKNAPRVVDRNAKETLNPDNPKQPGTRNPNARN